MKIYTFINGELRQGAVVRSELITVSPGVDFKIPSIKIGIKKPGRDYQFILVDLSHEQFIELQENEFVIIHDGDICPSGEESSDTTFSTKRIIPTKVTKISDNAICIFESLHEEYDYPTGRIYDEDRALSMPFPGNIISQGRSIKDGDENSSPDSKERAILAAVVKVGEIIKVDINSKSNTSYEHWFWNGQKMRKLKSYAV